MLRLLITDHIDDGMDLDPEISIVDIFKATPDELRKYSRSSEGVWF